MKQRIFRIAVSVEHVRGWVGEIAKLSGFRSVQYLCLCFKKQFGASPLAYRQSAAR